MIKEMDMPQFPDSFWKEECRIGFYVSEAMKRAWAIQLDMLEEILEVADKHRIKVWLDYGTLLGAVRHHGYIPWDDDIDISVMRADYVPLLRYLKEELPSYRDVRSIYTTPDFNQPKAVVASRERIDPGNNPDQKLITDAQYGFPCITWIDIFPMDYVSSDREFFATIRELYLVAHGIAFGMDLLAASGELEESLSSLEELTGTKVKRDENLRNSIWMLTEKIATMTTKKEASHIFWYPDFLHTTDGYRRPLSAFSDILFIEYEMLKAPIPAGYDTILRSVYGDRYMFPVKGSTSHEYPHYASQEKLILSYTRTGQLGDIF